MLKKLTGLLAMLTMTFFTAAALAAVDVNKADQATLESVKGIGPAMSTRILDERKRGAFKDWSDFIARVKGVGDGNASRFSGDGLTVNGQQFKVTANAPKPAITKAPSAKPAAAPAAPAKKG